MSKCILVVDDTDDLRMSIVETLQMEGYFVLQAINGLKAMEQLATRTPDLIITDLLMNEMDGFSLIREVRANSRIKQIKILVYSAMPAKENESKVMNLGSDLFLKKPSTLQTLVDTVAKLLSVDESDKSSHSR